MRHFAEYLLYRDRYVEILGFTFDFRRSRFRFSGHGRIPKPPRPHLSSRRNSRGIISNPGTRRSGINARCARASGDFRDDSPVLCAKPRGMERDGGRKSSAEARRGEILPR